MSDESMNWKFANAPQPSPILDEIRMNCILLMENGVTPAAAVMHPTTLAALYRELGYDPETATDLPKSVDGIRIDTDDKLRHYQPGQRPTVLMKVPVYNDKKGTIA